MLAVDQIAEVYGDSTHVALQTAQLEYRKITNPTQKDEAYQRLWTDEILPHLETSADNINRIIIDMQDKFRVSELAANMPAEQMQRYLDLTRSWMDEVAQIRNARLRQDKVRQQFFTESGLSYLEPGRRTGDEGHAFYSQYYYEVDLAWGEVEDARLLARNTGEQIRSSISGMGSARLVDASQISLVPDHIAQLFGVSSAELNSKLYMPEVMAFRGEKSFISKVRGKADELGKPQGRTANDLGYTTANVRRVYRDIMEKFVGRTGITDLNNGDPLLMPSLGQLNSAKDAVIRIGQQRHSIISDDTTEALRQIVGAPARDRTITADDGDIFTRPLTAEEVAETIRIKEDRVRSGTITQETADAIYGSPKIGDQGINPETIPALKQRVINIVNAEAPKINQFMEAWLDTSNNASLQSIGRLAQQKPEYVRKIREILRERFPTGYIKIYRGSSSQLGKRSLGPIGGREYVNVSSSSKAASEFEAAKLVDGLWTVKDPTINNITVSIDDIVAIGSVSESELIIPAHILRQRIAQPLVSTSIPAVRGTLQESIDGGSPALRQILSSDWQQLRKEALEETNFRWGQDFPDYDNATAVSRTLRSIFPFWTYEAHRWAWWLPREFTRHPGTYMSLGKYLDNTDGGYIHIPGTSYEVNPLRGGIFMGGFRRLAMRDYPEFYDQFEGFSEVLDQLGRFGFYPGFPTGFLMSVFGAKTGWMQIGELLPAWPKTMLAGITAIAPDRVDAFFEDLLPDRFRNLLIQRAVSAQGYDGVALLEKQLRGEQLSTVRSVDENGQEIPSEAEQWAAGRNEIAIYQILAEQTAILRFNPEERRRIFRQANEILADYYDVPLSFIEDLRRSGLRFTDFMGPTDPELRQLLQSIEGYSHHTGANIVLQPSLLGQQMLITTEFWDTVRNRSEELLAEFLVVEGEFKAGLRTVDNWLLELKRYQDAKASFIEGLKNVPKYSEVPMTIEERKDFALEHGMLEPMFHPIDELVQLWFGEELQEIIDPDTGQIVPDWETYFTRQGVIEQSVGADITGRMKGVISRNATPMMRIYADVVRDFIRPYKKLRDLVLTQFSPEEQGEIKRFLAADTIAQREEQQSLTTQAEGDEGNKLIATYNRRLRTAKENLRTANPELDGWLLVFQEVTTAKTDEARRWEQIHRQTLGLK